MFWFLLIQIYPVPSTRAGYYFNTFDMRPKNFIIDLGPYPFDVLVSINQTDKQLKKVFSDLDIEWEDEVWVADQKIQLGRTAMLETGQTVLRLIGWKVDAKGIGVLAHEAFHVAEFLFQRINMPHSVQYSSEAYAYLIGFIVEKALSNND